MAIGQAPNVEHKLKSSDDYHDAEIDHISELASQITIHDDRTTKTIDALRRRTRYADLSDVEEGTLIVFDRYYRHNFELHTSASRPYILFGTAGTPITIDLLEELLRLLRPGAFIDVQFAIPDGYTEDEETSEILAMIHMIQSVGLENVNIVHFRGSIEPELVQEIGQGKMDDWDGMPGEGLAPMHESLEYFCLWKDAPKAKMSQAERTSQQGKKDRGTSFESKDETDSAATAISLQTSFKAGTVRPCLVMMRLIEGLLRRIRDKIGLAEDVLRTPWRKAWPTRNSAEAQTRGFRAEAQSGQPCGVG
ncbi:hypothetical protein CTAM01_17229 [Colletotrichum tamarilloi]|uniref:Uncharacterized protein n=1 Tax=Colletotrichum tamarilloi TaxID=1209934 RepID=A0ABQ9QGN3_9PEZI|nr:uncharacterized protein CTAM01_17229 [Colletotrichum tamarilloi]KAK1456016.1 hypothetical protein CTAM01_17229 [Colletotrichum tamarilloi]